MPDNEKIANEILRILDDLIEGCETLDMDLAYGMFSRSPDFLMMNTDGALCDFATFYKNDVDYLGTCARFSLTTYSTDVRVIDRDHAVLAWSYKAEAFLKMGERDIVDKAGASFVFVRKEDEWKVAYYHQSSVPFRRLPNEAAEAVGD